MTYYLVVTPSSAATTNMSGVRNIMSASGAGFHGSISTRLSLRLFTALSLLLCPSSFLSLSFVSSLQRSPARPSTLFGAVCQLC